MIESEYLIIDPEAEAVGLRSILFTKRLAGLRPPDQRNLFCKSEARDVCNHRLAGGVVHITAGRIVDVHMMQRNEVLHPSEH